MKKIILLFAITFLFFDFSFAQTSINYNYNTTNAGNTFPLGSAAGKMVQWLFLPGELNQPAPARSGYITKVYCMVAANFGPFNYTNLRLMLGQSTITTLPTGVFYTGTMDTVYNHTGVSVQGVLLNWLEFTLDHMFYYDSTKSLIFQMEHYGASGSASYIFGNTFLTGKRRTYSTAPPFGVQSQDAYVQNFGITINPIMGITPPNVSAVPEKYSLAQNFPNPFNPATNIQFSIINVQFVSLKIFDILGREIKTLVYEKLKPGTYGVTFDGSNYPSGMYFYRLETNGFSETRKMLMIK